MKTRPIAYWISTVFVALIMTASGVLAISHAPAFMKALSHLGYPPYFSNLLGLGKLIGVCVLLAPGLPKLKEWAYVAFGVTLLSACYSHYNAGDGWLALEPLVTFAALMISYRTRPANRAFSKSSRGEFPLKSVQVAFAVVCLSWSAFGQQISCSGSAGHNTPTKAAIPVAFVITDDVVTADFAGPWDPNTLFQPGFSLHAGGV
jgi:hypothetical protein